MCVENNASIDAPIPSDADGSDPVPDLIHCDDEEELQTGDLGVLWW
jgi:hypothetical protein